MQQYNIYAVKNQLSSLVEKAAGGEGFVIAKAGKPMVKVIPYVPQNVGKNRIGFLRGQITIPEDFDKMGQDEITNMFEA